MISPPFFIFNDDHIIFSISRVSKLVHQFLVTYYIPIYTFRNFIKFGANMGSHFQTKKYFMKARHTYKYKSSISFTS